MMTVIVILLTFHQLPCISLHLQSNKVFIQNYEWNMSPLSYPRHVTVHPWYDTYWPGTQAFCVALYQRFLKSTYILSMLSFAFAPFSYIHTEAQALLNMSLSIHFVLFHIQEGGWNTVVPEYFLISSTVLLVRVFVSLQTV